MTKLLLSLAFALVIISCSGDRHASPEKEFSLVGTYKGTIEGIQCGAKGPVIRLVDDVDFVFADSTYWWRGASSSPLPEWGSGDYEVRGDSLFMIDCNFRLMHRCYIVTHGHFRFALDNDTLRFWYEQSSTGYFLRATIVKED